MKNKLIDAIQKTDYRKGGEYPSSYIKFIRKEQEDRREYYYFSVRSERLNRQYKVTIVTTDNVISHLDCTCPQFEITRSCKHVAATLLKYEDDIFTVASTENIQKISHDILNVLVPEEDHVQYTYLTLQVEIYLLEARYYAGGFGIRLRVGSERVYLVGNKIHTFLESFYKKGEAIYFGKLFTYDPRSQRFHSQDRKILSYLYEITEKSDYFGTDIYLEKEQTAFFLSLLKDKEFIILGEGTFHGIQEKNPFKSTLELKDNLYTYAIENMDEILPLTAHYEYIMQNKNVYHIPKKISSLIQELSSRHIHTLVFEDKDLPKFAKGILPDFKENISMDSVLEEKLTVIEPRTQVYLDIKGDTLTCDVTFLYGENKNNYFKKEVVSFLRNDVFEKKVVESLLEYPFVYQKNHLEMESLDTVASFLQDSLEDFSKKYEVYTTNALKNTNITGQSHISSQFSIGGDNIMKFSFEMEHIDPKELHSIFQSMNQKKRYYKLKSGSILSIENDPGLIELHSLIEDLDVSQESLKEGSIVIPKYRAIYLNSLRESKYTSVETNHLFDTFIHTFKQYRKANIEICETDQKILREYQIMGVKWLYNIYKCQLGAILADEMGLGKSIQVIFLLKQILQEKKDAKFLIIAPTSLIYNWENEFDKFGSELHYTVIAENKQNREERLRDENTSIFITTYGLMRKDREFYEKYEFEVMVLDEAQAIKNPGAEITKVVKKVNAHTKLALTGTPIENTVMELWSIFDFIMPGYLTNMTKFQKKYNKKEIDAADDSIKCLNMQISPFILRRKKKEVAKDLPSKIENNIFIELGDMQKAVYVGELQKTKEEMDALVKGEGFRQAQFKILQLLMKLRQICIDPRILYDNYKGGSAKMKELLSLVQDIIQNNHKILLFTSFKTALEIAEKEFAKHHIKTCRIDGSVSSRKRKELVDQFNEDDTHVFLIMLKSGGTGLNLTGADTVIHLDLWWNPQAENQATDRAHRIGQTRNVQVIKMICKGTIEERILELQNKKKVLSDTLIEGEDRDRNILSQLSETDIKQLLSYDEEQ